ncbi:MAG: hypothetical protein Q4C72_09855 [Eubacteriales bacterium]|nr:hypothetical protein [Eubacteriales bacterium]
MRRKLQTRKGETLVETLVAILVMALGSTAFLTMVLAANKLNGTAGIEDAAYFAQLSTAETGADTATAGAVTVDGDTVAVLVSGGEGELRSYRVGEGAGG